MERSVWTDERIDDLVTALDHKFDLVLAELHGLRRDMREELGAMRRDMREELGTMRGDMHEEARGLRAEVAAGRRTAAQIGFGLAGAAVTAFAAVVAALL